MDIQKITHIDRLLSATFERLHIFPGCMGRKGRYEPPKEA